MKRKQNMRQNDIGNVHKEHVTTLIDYVP